MGIRYQQSSQTGAVLQRTWRCIQVQARKIPLLGAICSTSLVVGCNLSQECSKGSANANQSPPEPRLELSIGQLQESLNNFQFELALANQSEFDLDCQVLVVAKRGDAPGNSRTQQSVLELWPMQSSPIKRQSIDASALQRNASDFRFGSMRVTAKTSSNQKIDLPLTPTFLKPRTSTGPEYEKISVYILAKDQKVIHEHHFYVF